MLILSKQFNLFLQRTVQTIYKILWDLVPLKMVEPMAMSPFAACLVHGLKRWLMVVKI